MIKSYEELLSQAAQLSSTRRLEPVSSAVTRCYTLLHAVKTLRLTADSDFHRSSYCHKPHNSQAPEDWSLFLAPLHAVTRCQDPPINR
ncbi:hypothetical protein RRG08_046018 [Elysia crispata]|uniref:Uncharacterized protein n=1 Tax=Elysia crispata TaxID=231223 RepID=A0AAE0ZE45_9GAST|nr:hypothetical protein RRG08_046018 [Elysia crispata]